MRHHISPATVIASVALFFSLAGAGIAAGYRITSIFQIKPDVRRALRGAQGPTGPPGAVGPAGAAGLGINWAGAYYVTSPEMPLNRTSGPISNTAVVDCGPGDHIIDGGAEGVNDVVTVDAVVPGLDSLGRFYAQQWTAQADLEPSATTGYIEATGECLPG